MSRIKWDKGYALEQAGDDAELVAELLEIFIDALHNDLGLIGQGLEDGSASLVHRAAHSIKGSAASLGITQITELALEIEEHSHAGNLEPARRKLPELQELLADLKKQ